MLEGFISGLFAAWFLSLFNVDGMLIEVIQPFVEISLTSSHYYIFLALIGVVGGVFKGKPN